MRYYMGMTFNGSKIATTNAHLREPKVKRVMISYYYYKFNSTARHIANKILEWNRNNPSERVDIMVDSGAFSLMVNDSKMKDIIIDDYVKEYADFVTENCDEISRFVELDIQSIVGVPEYERLYKLLNDNTPDSIKPTIVFHITETLEKLDDDINRCLAQDDDLICIGGAAALRITSRKDLGKMMQEICWYAAGKGVNVHGLGITSKVARYIDFYSVDSFSFIYDLINNREAEGEGNGRLRDNYGSYGGAVFATLQGKLMQYYWDIY